MMIVTDDKKQDTIASKAQAAAEDTQAGPSNAIHEDPPPAFEDIGEDGHLLADYPVPQPEDAPPEFAPYEAKFFRNGQGDVISHDPHLNTDGEALYRFLLQEAITWPKLLLNCKGTHEERRTRQVNHTQDGRTTTKIEHYTETVTDFDFNIDIRQSLDCHLTHFTMADTEPAYRGKSYKEVMTFKGTRKARRKETRLCKKWAKERRDIGLPPWIPSEFITQWDHAMVDPDSDGVYSSSKTAREWADEYCQSPKLLKEFVYEKVIYGWNLRQLEDRVRKSILRNTFYQGSLQVEIQTQAASIYIRPDNRLSRALSNQWIKLLLWITLIYPFVWLFKRFHHLGGGKYAVVGGAYALKRWVPGEAPQGTYRLTASDGTTRHLVGTREEEWLGNWQPTILKAVENRYVSFTAITQPIVGGETVTRGDMGQPLVGM